MEKGILTEDDLFSVNVVASFNDLKQQYDETSVLDISSTIPCWLVSGCFFLQSPPNHVIPPPEEIYVYSPLGTAFKVTGGDHSSKNPSIITM